jgi:hypothetical protein
MRHFPVACLLIGFASPFARADALSDQIDRAAERGVEALRALYEKGGEQAIGRAADSVNEMGRNALVGLTLLECGASPDDPLVRKIADKVRNQSVDNNRVYNLSLGILLFDRLGDDRDVPLIHAMGVRLMEAQFKEGGWSYLTTSPDEKETQRLKSVIQQRAELRTGGNAGLPPKKADGPPPIDPDLADRLKRFHRGPGQHQAEIQNNPLGNFIAGADNSNTQFAIMGLWTARHHGIPADPSLRLCEAYFRATHTRGTWPYSVQIGEPRGRSAMTCAGLMGLAIGAGVVRDRQLKTAPDAKGKPPVLRDPLSDPVVQAALNFVGEQLVRAVAQGLQGVPLDYYFVWSVERVGVTYSLTVIGGHKWHDLGAKCLIRHQRQDGTWSNDYGPLVDTCFALMFLKKANLARDLSATLLKKPGQPSMRAGGDKPDPEPKAEATGDPEKLRRELPTAAPARQTQILELLRDGKGAEYTEALVTAIPELKGEPLTKARDCLAERLTRMTAATLRDKLKDGRAEMRRAAALACAMKEDKAFLPDLIALLDDSDAKVVRAAGVALRSLTGQNFGPAVNATADERAKAVADWKVWWKQHKGK